ncbi:MAG: hypothetical protein E7632_14325 [Ruminococcaceae bacterium]|nr:hypothetical protein [Oscillospiraceae bacterium]
MKLKTIFLPFLMLLLCSLLCISAAAAEGGGFNAGLAVDRSGEETGSFTVTVQHSDVLVERQPQLRLPCSFETAKITAPDRTVQDGIIADGQVSFRVFMGGTYTISESVTPFVKLEEFTEEAIPQELKAMETLDTVEEIEAAMLAEIETHMEAGKMIDAVLHDAKLGYNTPAGVWVDADETNFPADGRLTVTADIPDGTHPDTHEYTVVHMFTSSFNGKTPGDMEHPECFVRQKADGSYELVFTVTGLSPIMIAWTEKQAEEESGIFSSYIMLLLKMKQEYDITVEPTEGGQVILTDEKVKYGKDTTFLVVPDDGYGIGKITANQKVLQAIDGVVTLTRVGRDQVIRVIFEKLLASNP